MNIALRVAALEREAAKRQNAARTIPPGKYTSDPLRYLRDVLRVELWGKQQEIFLGALRPPYRVLGRSSHSVGKTFVLACLVNYWYDNYDPGCVITTAPTHRDVCDLLWSEIRLLRQRAGLGGFVGDKSPEMRSSPDHYAKGFTASSGESFQGRHPERLLLVFDEATGVDPVFWATARTMFNADGGKHSWVCMFNPTDTSSQAYAEEQKVDVAGNPAWNVVEIGSVEHPNIRAQLDGKPIPYPGAVSLAQFNDWLAAWSDPIDAADAKPETDLEWPPNSGKWYRPGPLMEGRALGRYPSSATYAVWSDRVWRLALVPLLEVPNLAELPQLGCDVALFGDDYTTMHGRWGCKSLLHERHNGWEYGQTAERLMELCAELADLINRHRPPQAKPVRPQQIPVKVGADAYGSQVVLVGQKAGYNFIGVPESGVATRSRDYYNRRSELWFTTMERAKAGRLCLADLPQEHIQRIRQQCFAPRWWPDAAGRQQVELKKHTKDRLGCSPDDADALNMAYAEVEAFPKAETVDVPAPGGRRMEERDRRADRNSRGYFGR